VEERAYGHRGRVLDAPALPTAKELASSFPVAEADVVRDDVWLVRARAMGEDSRSYHVLQPLPSRVHRRVQAPPPSSVYLPRTLGVLHPRERITRPCASPYPSRRDRTKFVRRAMTMGYWSVGGFDSEMDWLNQCISYAIFFSFSLGFC